MKRIVLASIVAILCVLAFLRSSPVAAQNETPEDMLAKARNAISPSLAGPHQLEAEVTVLLPDGSQGKGTYSIQWAAPDRYREEIHLPDYDEIKITSGTTIYHKRSVDYIPLRAFQLEELMNPAAAVDQFEQDISPLLHKPGSAVSSGNQAAAQLEVDRVKIDDNEENCVSTASTVPELCSDAKHGWPLEITEATPEMDERLTFSKYAPLGEAHIPRERQYSENGVTTVEVKVRKFSSVQQFDAAAFTPPDGADQIPWCSGMVPAMRQPGSVAFSISPDDFPKPEVLYGRVSADGTLKSIKVIESGGPNADADIQEMADSIHFAPATCAGNPVESETQFIIVDTDIAPPIPAGAVPQAGKNGFTLPLCVFCPIPPFPGGAFDVKFQGKVILSVIIARDGRAHDIRIAKHLNREFDEQAARSVRNVWRFKPATGPDGKPAAVHVLVEVSFTAQSSFTSQLRREEVPFPSGSH